MFEKLKRKIRGIAYGLGFGMKAGDEIISTSNSESADGSITIGQEVNQNSVYKDLLKGEVTEEVEALRYSTFKAEEESLDYQYLGNGVAEKKEVSEEAKKKRRKHFTQPNLVLEYTQEEINKLPERDKVNPPVRHLIKIKYENPNVRFKLENYMDGVEVWVDKKEAKFTFENDATNRRRRPFVNSMVRFIAEAETMVPEALKTHYKRCDWVSDINELSFTTYKASNNVPNGIDYRFTNGHVKKIGIDEKTGNLYILYKYVSCDAGQLLSERFYSKLQDERYKNKEKREGYIPTLNIAKKTIE